MAPKGPLSTFRKSLLDANWTLFRDSLGGRCVRSSMILKGPVGESSLASSGHSHDRIDALFHSQVGKHSWKPESTTTLPPTTAPVIDRD